MCTQLPYYFMYPTVEEIEEPETVKIQGTLPGWMTGTFLRIGPGKFDFHNDFSVNHFLDGYAMLSRFQITGDRVTYDNKFLETDAFRRASFAQKPCVAEFGTKPYPDPSKSVFTRFLPSLIPEMSDNTNNSLFKLGPDLFVGADTCFFREIDPIDMTSKEKYDTSKLYGLNIWSAHPLKDDDGSVYNIGTSFITGLKYSVVKIPAPGPGDTTDDVLKRAKIICTISSRSLTAASPSHSFGMTKNYIIFIDQPAMVVGQRVLAAVISKTCNKDFIEWRPEMKNRFYVIEKATGKVVKQEFISSEAFFYMHFINCYEEDDEVVVDIVGFPNINCIHLMLDTLRNGLEGSEVDLARARRYVLPLLNDKEPIPENVNLVKRVETTATAIKCKKTIVVHPEYLSQPGIEVPTVHKDYFGKKYNVFYGGGPRTIGNYKHALVRIDIRTKEAKLFRHNEHCFYGEPVFVPNPCGTEEDDGILIDVVTPSVQDQKCFLLFLDGRNMKELARAEFSTFLPLAVHGIFLP